MAVLKLTNNETKGRLWLDARFSNSGVPFAELSKVPSFPKWVQPGEELEIDMGDWSELLYRKSLFPDNPHAMSDLHRIHMHGRSNTIAGFIWPTMSSSYSQTAPNTQHWLFDNRYTDYLVTKCGADAAQMTLACAQIGKNIFPDKILLTSKVRTVRNYLIEPFLSIGTVNPSDYPTCQIYVTLTDMTSGASAQKMFVEANPYACLSLAHQFVIKNGNLEAKCRTKMLAFACCESYRESGFRVPIQIPISTFFKNQGKCTSKLKM